LAIIYSTGQGLGVSSKGIGMGRHYQILIPLLSLFLVRVDLTDLYPLKIKVKIHQVYDGDTVLAGYGDYLFKVRFSKIDAPELNQPFLTSPFKSGLKAKECLEKTLNKSSVYFLFIEKRDIYGRILGDINQVSYELVQNGCVTLYPYADFSSKKEKFMYLKALKNAQALKIGLWKEGGFLSPGKWRKINKRSLHRQ
jgi:endonuclease YncB( thermonuclease family)